MPMLNGEALPVVVELTRRTRKHVKFAAFVQTSEKLRFVVVVIV
jgi:hypothetical protein